MKSIIKLAFIILVINVVLFSDIISAKNLKNEKEEKKDTQVHLVQDHNGFNSQINQVIRRTPTVTVATRLGASKLEPPSNIIYSSNSNTSNGPNVGSLGKTAELVGPHMVMHGKSGISVVTETPAHIGWRNEQKTLTTLNSNTGKVEQHTLTNKVPIYGNVQEVKNIYKSTTRSLDLNTKTFGPIGNSISDS